MNLTGFDCYRYYLATKTHFTSNTFNVFEHRGSRCSMESYEERRDFSCFESIAKKFDDPQKYIQFLVANISIGFEGFLYDRETAMDNYKAWVAYKEGFSYRFEVDLRTIDSYSERWNSYFEESSWKCYLNKSINIQTIHVINELIKIFKEFDDSSLLLHREDILRIRKLRGFIKISEKIKYIFEQHRRESLELNEA